MQKKKSLNKKKVLGLEEMDDFSSLKNMETLILSATETVQKGIAKNKLAILLISIMTFT